MALPRVAIVGLGGVGGIVAASLVSVRAARVTLVARGPTVMALKRSGLKVQTHEGSNVALPLGGPEALVVSSDDIDALQEQDFVLVATKAHQLASTLGALKGLVAPKTTIVPCTNGLPWWFFDPAAVGGNSPIRLKCNDPDGLLAQQIDAAQVLGCVGMVSARREGGAYVSQWASNKNLLVVGAPGGRAATAAATASVRALVELFARTAEGPVPVRVAPSLDIRSAIWDKLLINCSINRCAPRAKCAKMLPWLYH